MLRNRLSSRVQRFLRREIAPISRARQGYDSIAPLSGKRLAKTLLLFIYQLTQLLLFGK